MVSPHDPAAGGGAHASRGDGPPSGALRIGDRERDEVTRLLHDAFAQGRITREELDERLDATLSARTAEDLRRVTADLPGQAAGAWGDRLADEGHWAGDAGGAGRWHPGPRSGGAPGFPGLRPGPYVAPWPGASLWGGPEAGPPWARRHRHHHGPAAWGPHPAAYRAGMARRRGGPAPIALAAVAVLVVALVTGAWPLFVIVRLLFVAWLVTTVLRLVRHRHGPRRHGVGHR